MQKAFCDLKHRLSTEKYLCKNHQTVSEIKHACIVMSLIINVDIIGGFTPRKSPESDSLTSSPDNSPEIPQVKQEETPEHSSPESSNQPRPKVYLMG